MTLWNSTYAPLQDYFYRYEKIYKQKHKLLVHHLSYILFWKQSVELMRRT